MPKTDREADVIANSLESLMRARQACKTEDAAEAFTYEIGLLVCGHPETILAHLRTPASGEAGEMVALLQRDAEKLGGPLTETEMKGWVTPQRMLDAICAERFIAAADLISRLSATDTEAMRLLREARDHLNTTSAITGNLEWKADLGELVDRIDALAKGRG